jgi:thioredoxin reductase
MPERLDFDAAIVGGGPAGLAAAVNLARALHSVVVCDRPQPGRSDYPQVNHNYPGFPEGIPAQELRAGNGSGRAVQRTVLRRGGGSDPANA